MNIAGMTALVTGGANGIGFAIAQALMDAGGRPILADIDGDALTNAARELGNVPHFEMDTTDRTAWARLREQVGIVDILVNNAGIGPDGRTLADMEPASFDRVIAINLIGVFNGVSTFAAGMRERGSGHIVNIASMAALVWPATIGAYAAAKSGVVGLSEVLRSELADHGVGVSVIFPGMVTTRLRETTRRAGSETPTGAPTLSREAMAASVIGGLVVEAICSGRPMVASHPEYREAVERRIEEILRGFD